MSQLPSSILVSNESKYATDHFNACSEDFALSENDWDDDKVSSNYTKYVRQDELLAWAENQKKDMNTRGSFVDRGYVCAIDALIKELKTM